MFSYRLILSVSLPFKYYPYKCRSETLQFNYHPTIKLFCIDVFGGTKDSRIK